MGQWGKQKGNSKTPWDKWQWKHNHKKSMGCTKAGIRGKFIEIQAFLKKQEKSQINNLTYHLKELEKEN